MRRPPGATFSHTEAYYDGGWWAAYIYDLPDGTQWGEREMISRREASEINAYNLYRRIHRTPQ